MQKTEYAVRISVWSSDVCSSDLAVDDISVIDADIGPVADARADCGRTTQSGAPIGARPQVDDAAFGQQRLPGRAGVEAPAFVRRISCIGCDGCGLIRSAANAFIFAEHAGGRREVGLPIGKIERASCRERVWPSG